MFKYIVFLFLLAGCYTSQKAIKQANKAIKEHPADVLPLFRANFPCDVLHVDTSIIYTDTVINFECPEQVLPQIDTVLDTVTRVIFKAGKTTVVTKKIQLPAKIITKSVLDSSLTRELQLKLLVCETNYAVDLKELEKAKKGNKTRNYWIFSLILLLIISVLTHFIRKK